MKKIFALCIILLSLPLISAEERVFYTVFPVENMRYPAFTNKNNDLIISLYEEIGINFRIEEKVVIEYMGTQIVTWETSQKNMYPHKIVIDGVPMEDTKVTLEKGDHSLYLIDENGVKVENSERTIKIVKRGSSLPSFAIAILYFGIGLFISYKRKMKKG